MLNALVTATTVAAEHRSRYSRSPRYCVSEIRVFLDVPGVSEQREVRSSSKLCDLKEAIRVHNGKRTHDVRGAIR